MVLKFKEFFFYRSGFTNFNDGIKKTYVFASYIYMTDHNTLKNLS